MVEIGSGWGGFAIYAAQHYGCRVTTITISQAQYDEAVTRVNEAGLAHRIDVQLKDYVCSKASSISWFQLKWLRQLVRNIYRHTLINVKHY